MKWHNRSGRQLGNVSNALKMFLSVDPAILLLGIIPIRSEPYTKITVQSVIQSSEELARMFLN